MLRVKELRLEKQLEQQDLAKIIQIGKGSISNWETGRTEPSIEYLLKLADFFEVSIDYLLGRSDDLGIVNVQTNLNTEQNELVNYYNQMSEKDKAKLLGYAKGLVD